MQEFINYGIIPKSNADSQKLKCPKCLSSRKNKTDKPLSISLSKGVFNCHNCGWSGNVKFKEKKEFIKPIKVKSKLSSEVLSWFEKRGVSKITLSDWNITEGIEFMPQVGKKRKTIHFNYYRNNELINVKYRDGDKNFKSLKSHIHTPFLSTTM